MRSRPSARTTVAGASLLSGVIYVACSEELRFELRDQTYKQALLRGFFRDRGLSGIHLLRPVSGSGLSLLLLLVAIAVIAGLLVRRAYGATRGRLELCTFAVAAITIPALLLATVLWPDGAGDLGSLQLLAATAAGAGVAAICAGIAKPGVAGLLPPSPRSQDDAGDPGHRWALAFLALLVPLAIALWWNAVVDIRGFDSLADHLPRAARWLRLHRLAEESGPLLTPYYPGNFQLLLRWMLVLGTDAYAFVPSLLASVLALSAIYGICRELGQPRWTALVSTAAAASCSLIPYLSTTAQADTATAAWLLAAVFFLLRWQRSLRIPEGDEDVSPSYNAATLAAIGTSLGLAIGTKYSALPSAFVIATAVAIYARRAAEGVLPTGDRFINMRTFVVLLGAVAAPAVLAGGYWFLRNTIVHHNPLYPVAVGGLPGLPLSNISIVKPALAGSVFKQLTYPWAQWQFGYQYDDGIGAVFPVVAVVGFIAVMFRRARGTRRRLVWLITVASYLLWLITGSIMVRFGIFPILLTYVFVGEAWREFESVALKSVTLAAFALSVGVMTYSLVFGAVYTESVASARARISAMVDTLPPTRIFNATSAGNRYALLGSDYRHDVVTMFRDAKPTDVAETHARYVLLSAKQVPAFTGGGALRLVTTAPAMYGDTLSLWRTP